MLVNLPTQLGNMSFTAAIAMDWLYLCISPQCPLKETVHVFKNIPPKKPETAGAGKLWLQCFGLGVGYSGGFSS